MDCVTGTKDVWRVLLVPEDAAACAYLTCAVFRADFMDYGTCHFLDLFSLSLNGICSCQVKQSSLLAFLM